MANQSKISDPRFWERWRRSGAVGTINDYANKTPYVKEAVSKKVFEVQDNGESLAARLIENGVREIELTLTRPNGDKQVGRYRNGLEVSTMTTLANGYNPMQDLEGNTILLGCLVSYDRLGPSLRAQIPAEWHPVLGLWLAPKTVEYHLKSIQASVTIPAEYAEEAGRLVSLAMEGKGLAASLSDQPYLRNPGILARTLSLAQTPESLRLQDEVFLRVCMFRNEPELRGPQRQEAMELDRLLDQAMTELTSPANSYR